MKSNLKCYKQFMEQKDINTQVVSVNGTRIRLVKYWIDKNTKKCINRYAEDGFIDNDDLSDCFVLATNDISLSIDDCIFLYKKRWTVEIAFKQLKQHFKIRYVNKQITMKTPLEKCEFWFKMSFFMFNMTHVLKNCIYKNKKK